MGDRRNVIVEQDNGTDLVFYTHWDGSELPETLAKALKRGKPRWTDPTYLARIIFSEMIQGYVLDETGYGIEAVPAGSEDYCEATPGYDPRVNVKDKTVTLEGVTHSFEDFVRDFE